MRAKSLLATAVCVVAVAGLTAAPAFAGEITGNGKWIAGSEEAPLHGKSECAYSGQNDEYVLGDPSAPRAQSWGHVVTEFVPVVGGGAGVPGVACNPTSGFEE
jgi:hypothetical protein